MDTFDKEKIRQIQVKLQTKTQLPATEEATKQWLIMPVIVALGYDPYSSDVIPEYTLDVGIKKGERVDYALQINNKPVAIMECKQLDTNLGERNISQLFRYFSIASVHVAILTNGDDYWFFTDSKEPNKMDLEPYYKLRLSRADDYDLEILRRYSKETIQNTDIVKLVQAERFKATCTEVADGLLGNDIPDWLLEGIAEQCGVKDLTMSVMATYMHAAMIEHISGFKTRPKPQKPPEKPKRQEPKSTADSGPSELGKQMKQTREENKKNISNIQLNHEYVYNDYSDGDWKFHVLDYAVIFGERFEDMSGRSLLIQVIKELLKNEYIQKDVILREKQFQGTYKLSEEGDFRGAAMIEPYSFYIGTSFGIDGIVKFIEKLLAYAGVPDDSVKVSFKE